MANLDDTIRRYEAERARLDEMERDLERLGRHTPRLFWLLLGAPIAWALGGVVWALIAVGVVCSMVGVQAYLVGVRKGENRGQQILIARDLEDLLAAKARGETEVHSFGPGGAAKP